MTVPAPALAEVRAQQMMRQLLGKRRRRRVRVPAQRHPRGGRIRLLSQFRRIHAEVRSLIEDRLIPELPRLIALSEQVRPDSKLVRIDQSAEEIDRILDEIADSADVATARQRLMTIAQEVGVGVSQFNRVQVSRQLMSTVGIELPSREGFVSDQVGAFSRDTASLARRRLLLMVDEVRAAAHRNVRARSATPAKIRADITGRLAVAASALALIAADQISKLDGELTQLRQQSVGIEEYEWVTVGDDRVRPDHRALSGRRFRWDSPPSIGHPGGPVNCFPGDTIVLTPDAISKAYRRHYEGELVVLESESWSIRCTPNHPILTEHGFVPAKELHEGDKLIKASLDASSLGDDNRHQVRLDELWDFARGVGLSSRRSGWFHGDCSPDDEVNVVHVHRNLGPHIPALCAECFEELVLAKPDAATSRFSSLDELMPGALDASCRVMGGSSASSPLSRRHAGRHCKHCSRAAPSLAPVFNQPSGKQRPGHRAFAGKGLDRLAMGVSLHQISKPVRRVQFSGHVYNLETPSSWYVASATVVHNCRCRAVPVVDPLLSS